MAELTQQKPIIRITFDEMEAYMLLPEPEQGTGYTDSQIRQEMAARGITTGIDEQRISDMLEGHTYNAELLVAQGKKPVDGTDGYYEYKFDTNFDGKPKLLPDGSVELLVGTFDRVCDCRSGDCRVSPCCVWRGWNVGQGQAGACQARKRTDAVKGQRFRSYGR